MGVGDKGVGQGLVGSFVGVGVGGGKLLLKFTFLLLCESKK